MRNSNRYRTCRARRASPADSYATLLDEGVYHGSIRTMYQILNRPVAKVRLD